MINNIAFVGAGKMGQLMANIFSQIKEIQITLFDLKPCSPNIFSLDQFSSWSKNNQSALIIIAVPTSAFNETLLFLKDKVFKTQIIMDVCSVKLYPQQQLEEIFDELQTICCHPLWGPASYHANNKSVSGLRVTIENLNAEQANYNAVKDLWNSLKVDLVEMSADQHDKLIGAPQFLTHLLSELFREEISKDIIAGTKSVDGLRDVLSLLTSDPHLLMDLYKFNPYARKSFKQILKRFENISLVFKLQEIE